MHLEIRQSSLLWNEMIDLLPLSRDHWRVHGKPVVANVFSRTKRYKLSPDPRRSARQGFWSPLRTIWPNESPPAPLLGQRPLLLIASMLAIASSGSLALSLFISTPSSFSFLSQRSALKIWDLKSSSSSRASFLALQKQENFTCFSYSMLFFSFFG